MIMPRPAFRARKLSIRTNSLYQIATTKLPHNAGGKVGSVGMIAVGALGSVIQTFSQLKLVRWWMIAAVSGAALAWYSHGPGDPIQAATQAAITALWS